MKSSHLLRNTEPKVGLGALDSETKEKEQSPFTMYTFPCLFQKGTVLELGTPLLGTSAIWNTDTNPSPCVMYQDQMMSCMLQEFVGTSGLFCTETCSLVTQMSSCLSVILCQAYQSPQDNSTKLLKQVFLQTKYSRLLLILFNRTSQFKS